ncbi:AMSH-like ubiquitin thioesterase 3 [Ipomoea triloba]|uniref:AMSH-like ubiquitin thioesterase 3 n=2 Tax=Ipomoea triloba TaxID=35885 RepID=UPI00125E0CF3|nr:AMSH-like ubiquitin thioesterase 3 [Ipomoea triloba]
MSRPSINVSFMTRKVDVDNRIPLRNYYRIADNILRQANIYRGEKNIIDLYIMLLRYSSLLTETIPCHRDYQTLYPKERTSSRKTLLRVLDELEALKPTFLRQVNELEKRQVKAQPYQLESSEITPTVSSRNSLGRPALDNKASSGYDNKWVVSSTTSKWKQNNDHPQVSSLNSIDLQFQKLSLSLPLPKQETLSRHSLLGPNGLHGQWHGPSAEIKVNYPTNTYLDSDDMSSLKQVGHYDRIAFKDADSKVDNPTMESVLSLDDGRWSQPTEDASSFYDDVRNDNLSSNIIHQPSPPPVLAQVQQEYRPISPSRVADPRPGPVKPQDGMTGSNAYQHLHIPVRMMEDFLRLAKANTTKNLETCGVLAGSLKNRVFHITTLIIPKQESTSDSCQTLNEEEIFEVQDKLSLFPLGWIHTHPSQTCFMSSVDLHTHYSYQIMLPEAIAIVMAPTDESSPHGIFHLSDPGGVSVIRNCQQRGFHPHEEAEDGSPIYEHCSHVYMNANLKFDVVDLR